MENKNPIQVAARLFDVLELLSENDPMGLFDISARLGLNKSTAHRILCSLIYMGYAVQEDGQYRASFKLVQLADEIMSRTDIVRLAHPYLRRLMEQAGETVHLVQREGAGAVYIDKVESRADGIQMVSRIGRKIPLFCSGVGKAIAAELSEEERRAVWESSEIVRLTPYTITDYGQFLHELEETRKRGYALDNEENETGVRCIAVSLRDYAGRPRYALSISAPVMRMDNDRIRELSGYILKTREEIEKNF
ncbi:IclR family transcriptional regulator [Lachnoclostridium sp. Marseille-P6806]|uniref:IclR family transcriptional regulator n=1 Tax=Lachnoclostridium sp. Marseille-P6806 TaxID=2364793 RepID=UPI00102FF55F|nr:IclR family transcriptional regulator [Lachnoclostridium sp. Marseille-P6806]